MVRHTWVAGIKVVNTQVIKHCNEGVIRMEVPQWDPGVDPCVVGAGAKLIPISWQHFFQNNP